jgi:hypothetical protein
MFVTHPGTELRGGLQFGDGTQQWAIIEQELAIPWLYVCVTQIDHTFDFQRMLLVSCVDHFVQLLDGLPANASVTRVMSVVPNQDSSGIWSMVLVQTIELHENNGRATVTINLANGSQYQEPVRNLGSYSGERPLYRAS